MTEKPAPLCIFIADDEEPARARIRIVLEDIADDFPSIVIGEAANGQEALQKLQNDPVDVVLLDIRMPDINGIELARRLTELPNPPIVIFTTAYDIHALEAFEVSAIDYLVKPIRAVRLSAALEKVRRILDRRNRTKSATEPGGQRNHLTSYLRGKIFMVPLADILYLKADLKYVTAYTAHREYLIDEALTQLEKEFSDYFIRLHRGILVARNALIGFEKQDSSEAGWVALIRDSNEKLPISRRQWTHVRALLHNEKK